MYISTIVVTLNLMNLVYFLSAVEISFFFMMNFAVTESLLEFSIDQLLFSFSVIIITLVIFFFSMIYMKEDFLKNNFFFLTFLFVLSMVIFIHSKSMMLLILGWEGLGIFSYLLVIYYLKNNSLMSGILTLMINRMGDSFFITCISMWLMNEKSLYLGNCYSNADSSNKLLFIILLFLILCMTSKSPQYPLNSWLLAAMAAPTPISSLVHSSTLVTAGCYFFLKMIMVFFFFEMKFFFMNLMIMTILLSSGSGLVIFDMKKIIALSTLSQISMIFLMFLTNLKVLGLVHMIFHAFFKSSLFLISGIIMMMSYSNQDCRFQSQSMTKMSTILMWVYINFSLTASFFSLSFFTKEKLISYFFFFDLWYSFIFFFSCLLTLTYSWKLFYSLNLLKLFGVNFTSVWNFPVFPLMLLLLSMLIFKVSDLDFMKNDYFPFSGLFPFSEQLILSLFLLYFFFSNFSMILLSIMSTLKNMFFSMNLSSSNWIFKNFFFFLKKGNDKAWSDVFFFSGYFLIHAQMKSLSAGVYSTFSLMIMSLFTMSFMFIF